MANHPDRSNQLPIFGKQVQLARAAHMNQAELIVSLVPSIGYFDIVLSFLENQKHLTSSQLNTFIMQ